MHALVIVVYSFNSVMSALPPKADIDFACRDVRFVPKADMVRCGERHRYSITSSARPDSGKGQ